MGIENLKKCIAFIVELGNVIEQMVVAKGVAAKLSPIANLLDEAMALAGVEWSKLDDEFKDLSEAEKTELMEFVKVKFDIADDKIEVVVEKCLDMFAKLVGIIQGILDIVRSFKK